MRLLYGTLTLIIYPLLIILIFFRKIINKEDEKFLFYSLISLSDKGWKNIHPEHLKLILNGYLQYKDGALFRNIVLELFKNYNFISYRITHYNDIVPHLPLESLGYNHIPQEVWYNKDNTKYKICNDYYIEDDECSNSCYPLNCDSISDHKYYLNITFGREGSC